MTETRDRILEMARKRVPPHAIAKHLNVSRSKVYNRIRLARAEGEAIPSFRELKAADRVDPADLPHQFNIPQQLQGLLQSYAASRGLTPAEAGVRILET
ncbi:MAG: helix-turn-helix domain-containing protein, partial [Donghicola eburneus]